MNSFENKIKEVKFFDQQDVETRLEDMQKIGRQTSEHP